ncbi:hypothetical protein MAPG_01421 [Magnaporthiopsis poae ATCC 64411]|uniref:Uncharacterized protein n=1 Tax=Magnaporthiopsis poae (strain ATCC 64411 / 73-15) TaxID=644358 RepID=A0A0C4DNM9_MAGP6|nr:hypothetical protein MAPG_01421 [Magnaporthiopsis poae ATCC 64411]
MSSSQRGTHKAVMDRMRRSNRGMQTLYEAQLWEQDVSTVQTLQDWIQKLEGLQSLYKTAAHRSRREQDDAKHFFTLTDLLQTALFYLFPLAVNTRSEALSAMDRCTSVGSCERNRRYLDVRLLNARAQAHEVVRELRDDTRFPKDLAAAVDETAVQDGHLLDACLVKMMPSYGYDEVSRSYFFSPAVSRCRFPPPDKAGRHLFTVVPDLIDHTVFFRLHRLKEEALAKVLRSMLFVPAAQPPTPADDDVGVSQTERQLREEHRRIRYLEEQRDRPLARRDVPFPEPPRLRDVSPESVNPAEPGPRPFNFREYAVKRLNPASSSTVTEIRLRDHLLGRLRAVIAEM